MKQKQHSTKRTPTPSAKTNNSRKDNHRAQSDKGKRKEDRDNAPANTNASEKTSRKDSERIRF